jgi:hypothetical protein
MIEIIRGIVNDYQCVKGGLFKWGINIKHWRFLSTFVQQASNIYMLERCKKAEIIAKYAVVDTIN